MKSRLEKVYGKMPKQKVDLKKIELSLIDDIKRELDAGFSFDLQNEINNIRKQIDESKKVLNNEMYNALNNSELWISEAEEKLNELGADTNLLNPMIDRLNDLSDLIKDLESQLINIGE